MKVYLETEDVKALENAATCQRDRLLIHLLARIGCRISEALGLTIGDINFDEGTIRIEHLKVRLELNCPECHARLGKSHAFCPKCGKPVSQAVSKEKEHRRMRTLPVDSDTLEFLKRYIDQGGAVLKGGRSLIFGINRHRAWQIITSCAKKSGLPDLINQETGKLHHVSPHRLRDFLAIRAMKCDDSGDGLRLLQEQLGHQSFNTTARYRKVSGGEQREWYDRLWKNEKP